MSLPLKKVSEVISVTSVTSVASVAKKIRRLTFFLDKHIMIHMKINISEITKAFAPKIRYAKVEGCFHLNHEQKIFNDAFYTKIEKLTDKAYPSRENRKKYFPYIQWGKIKVVKLK